VAGPREGSSTPKPRRGLCKRSTGRISIGPFRKGTPRLGCGPAAARAPDQPAQAEYAVSFLPLRLARNLQFNNRPEDRLKLLQFPLIFASSSSSEAFGALFSERRRPPQRGNPSAAFTTFVRGAPQEARRCVGGPWRPGARAASARPMRGRLCARRAPGATGRTVCRSYRHPPAPRRLPAEGCPSLREPLRRPREAVTPI
jgi:hypothetical protein